MRRGEHFNASPIEPGIITSLATSMDNTLSPSTLAYLVTRLIVVARPVASLLQAAIQLSQQCTVQQTPKLISETAYFIIFDFVILPFTCRKNRIEITSFKIQWNQGA